MILSVKELTQWLGLTPFEIWLHLAAALVFCVLVVLRDLFPDTITWWHAMAPLFVCDALSAYFCVIMLIRTYIDGWYKPAAMRALWSFFVLALMFTFKYLLVRKLTDNIGFEYSEVMAPLFVILNMVMVRACQL
ncbi:LOW QUALITY PROTEIN: transmembrane protein 203-like [Pollicipes pollicipes]|uniref:LOW QUALITY PROTEIN: transmembrane protein 203-like n=1 Tax=Pollicipes pollicipes TaxID=41117 RepID=UPI001884D5D7|nr:LOW QUALITY PROTEIN: transmembrane protein 203-like [Pollicipes pollicipes]